jgi:hypothetical protein
VNVAFIEDPEKRFWQFVVERQSIWHRRFVLSYARPWTDDPILHRYKFCNVIRDLDIGTQIIKRNVLQNEYLSTAQKVHAVIFYRMLNNYHTWLYITGMPTNNEEMRTALGRLDGKKKVWSSAWISTAMVKAAPKIVATDYTELVNLVSAAPNDVPTSAVHAVIKRYPGLSGLVGFQMALDLSTIHPRRSADVVQAHRSHYNQARGDNASGSWVGASIIDLTREPHEVIEHLHRRTALELVGTGVDWPKITPAGYTDLHLHDIEHALCEWTKYERIRNGAKPNRSCNYVLKSERDVRW